MLAELATALHGLGKHAEAQRCCTAAVTARPDYQRGWLELGRAQAAQGQSLIIDTTIDQYQLHVARHAGRELFMEHCCPSTGSSLYDEMPACSSKTCMMIAHTCMLVCATAHLVTAASQSLLLFCINPLDSACTALPLGVLMTGCGQCMHLSLCVTVAAPIMACMSCMSKAAFGPIAAFAFQAWLICNGIRF